MGAVESLDHCCSERSDEKAQKKYMGKWREPVKRNQRELNTDYGNGPAICDEPLKDLKLDKSIDAEIATVFKEVGHRFPFPIYSERQLNDILQGFKKRGYSFTQTDKKICEKLLAHPCNRITILEFRDWFQTEVSVCRNNLRALLRRSRYVSDLVTRVYDESEHEDDKMAGLHDAVNSLRRHLDENPISSADILMTARQVIDRTGKVNYMLSGSGKMLFEDFEALVTELLVQLYYEHFNDSLYSCESQSFSGFDFKDAPDVKSKAKVTKMKSLKMRFPSGLSTYQAGVDRCRKVAESLPVGETPEDNRTARSLKFPIGTPFPGGAFPIGAAAA